MNIDERFCEELKAIKTFSIKKTGTGEESEHVSGGGN
jgi:hypothetical protein